jgi:hypothetical protein
MTVIPRSGSAKFVSLQTLVQFGGIQFGGGFPNRRRGQLLLRIKSESDRAMHSEELFRRGTNSMPAWQAVRPHSAHFVHT